MLLVAKSITGALSIRAISLRVRTKEADMRALVLAAMISVAAAPAMAVPADVKASVAATAARSVANVKLDALRKPVQLLNWLGLQKGDRVADMFGGNMYWAEIFGPAIGPKGRVTIWQPQQFYGQKVFDRLTALTKKQPNVFMRVSPFEAPNLPANTYDFMLINLDYHDVYWEDADSKIGPRCVAQDHLCRAEAGRDVGRRRPCRQPRRHEGDRPEAAPDRPGDGQGRFQASRLRPGRREQHASQPRRRP